MQASGGPDEDIN